MMGIWSKLLRLFSRYNCVGVSKLSGSFCFPCCFFVGLMATPFYQRKARGRSRGFLLLIAYVGLARFPVFPATCFVATPVSMLLSLVVRRVKRTWRCSTPLNEGCRVLAYWLRRVLAYIGLCYFEVV